MRLFIFRPKKIDERVYAPCPSFSRDRGRGGYSSRRKKFQFQLQRSIKGESKISSTYGEDKKSMDQLILDLWNWLHEDAEVEISIVKERV